MNEILKDSRFSHVVRDPKFRKLRKKRVKVKIDERFQSMFNDEKFQIRSKIDERGRSVKLKRSKDLKRYYDISESSEEEVDKDEDKSESEEEIDEKKNKSESEEEVDEEEKNIKSEEETDEDDENIESEEDTDENEENIESEEETDEDESDEKTKSKESKKVKENKKKPLTKESKNNNSDLKKPSKDGNKVPKKHKSNLPSYVKKKLKDLSVDYARGEGAIFSESSSEEESSDESESLEFDHMWGELDKDVETTDESTNRLAVCNMNWDRIKAADLMILFNSLLPPDGLIHSVTIYPSEFGMERMKEEEKKGPEELINAQKEEENEDEEVLMEKLRKYQLNRLKYYYAVVVCDSPETANVLYKEADGLEYESSCNKLDLRFIPDDVTFDQEPRETCTQMPDSNEYVPKAFETTALTKAKVNLTWDETDKARMDIVRSACEGNIDENGLKQLIASSSSEESEEEIENNDSDARSDTKSNMGYIDKYKALLADIENKEKTRKNNEVNLEVKWNLNLENKANEFVKEATKGKDEKTPFQQYLEKRKEKKKKKREERKAQFQKENQGSGESVFSDDDIPSDVDLNDPYFKEEFENVKKKKEKKKKPKEEEEDDETKQKKAELELLMLDDEDESKHFSLKKIKESEKASKKSKKSKNDSKFVDDFKMDLNDERFSAVFTSHHFNIDPTDPQFKPTKATKALIEEKLKRREREDPIFPQKRINEEEKTSNKKFKSAELSVLVKNIKKNISEVKK